MNKLITLLISTAFMSATAFATASKVEEVKTADAKEAPKEVKVEVKAEVKAEEVKDVKIDVQNANVTLPAPGSKNTALFFTVKNPAAKDLTILDVTATEVANKTELHDTKKDDKGVVSMQKIDNIKVAAGQSVELKSGGLHVMLLDLKKDLKEGDKVDVIINTKEAGAQKVSAIVKK